MTDDDKPADALAFVRKVLADVEAEHGAALLVTAEQLCTPMVPPPGAYDTTPVPASLLADVVAATEAAAFLVKGVGTWVESAPHCDELHAVAIQTAREALQRADAAIQRFRDARECKGTA